MIQAFDGYESIRRGFYGSIPKWHACNIRLVSQTETKTTENINSAYYTYGVENQQVEKNLIELFQGKESTVQITIGTIQKSDCYKVDFIRHDFIVTIWNRVGFIKISMEHLILKLLWYFKIKYLWRRKDETFMK